MALFAIADLHLSLNADKPMDIFHGWSDYVNRIENNWRRIVTNDDTVVIAGDISWANRLEETEKDFAFINSLPGTKLIMKGNHDYWWTTKKKMDEYLKEKGFETIRILFNNSYTVGETSVCGTRGWFYDAEEDADKKILNREIGRFRLSYNMAENKPPVAFLHYPPVYGDSECEEMLNVLLETGIKNCYYGHIHGGGSRRAVTGMYKGINFRLISCDYLKFTPLLVAK